jgi:hypothetical protein
MEDIINTIINSKNNDIPKILNILLFNTIYNKYPTQNTISLIDTIYYKFDKNIDIFNMINYEAWLTIIKKKNNDLLYGYLIILYEYNEKKNTINEIIKIFNKYKFNLKEDIQVDTLKIYIITKLKPYLNAHFDDKFITLINVPLDIPSWLTIHHNEIIYRLTNITKLFNYNINIICDIKPQPIEILNNLPFDELTKYFIIYANKIMKKIDYICKCIDRYEILNNNIIKLIEHNNKFIKTDAFFDMTDEFNIKINKML